MNGKQKYSEELWWSILANQVIINQQKNAINQWKLINDKAFFFGWKKW